jgi:hypothetical protein
LGSGAAIAPGRLHHFSVGMHAAVMERPASGDSITTERLVMEK